MDTRGLSVLTPAVGCSGTPRWQLSCKLIFGHRLDMQCRNMFADTPIGVGMSVLVAWRCGGGTCASLAAALFELHPTVSTSRQGKTSKST
jgi:hypothetical protein